MKSCGGGRFRRWGYPTSVLRKGLVICTAEPLQRLNRLLFNSHANENLLEDHIYPLTDGNQASMNETQFLLSLARL